VRCSGTGYRVRWVQCPGKCQIPTHGISEANVGEWGDRTVALTSCSMSIICCQYLELPTQCACAIFDRRSLISGDRRVAQPQIGTPAECTAYRILVGRTARGGRAEHSGKLPGCFVRRSKVSHQCGQLQKHKFRRNNEARYRSAGSLGQSQAKPIHTR